MNKVQINKAVVVLEQYQRERKGEVEIEDIISMKQRNAAFEIALKYIVLDGLESTYDYLRRRTHEHIPPSEITTIINIAIEKLKRLL
jgi:hypothetical protein